MKESLQQIEENINGLLDIYDQAIDDRNRTKNVVEEKKHNEMALKTVECIQYELAKIAKLRGFDEEVQIITELNTCVDLGREELQ